MGAAPGAPGLAVSSPTDPAEREADAVADRVTDADVDASPEGGGLQEGRGAALRPLVSIARSDDGRHIRRQLALGPTSDPLEDEAEEAAASVDRPVEMEGGSEDDDEDQDESEADEGGGEVLAKRAPGAGTPGPSASFQTNLAAAEAAGASLPDGTRDRMERAFGVDFGAVRVHDDERSGSLASSIDSLAFTHGTHVHFAPGQYRPETRDGLHLLAHELAHVVQVGSSAGGPIRRKPAPRPGAGRRGRKIGRLFLFDASGKSFASVKFFDLAEDSIDVPEGVYRVELVTNDEGKRVFRLQDGTELPIVVTLLPKAFLEQMQKAAFMRLRILRPTPGAKGSGDTPAAPEQEGVFGEFDQEGNLILPPGSNVSPVTRPEGEAPAPGEPEKKEKEPGEQEGKKGEQPPQQTAPDADKKGEGGKAKKGGGEGTTTTGSKYGWLGLLPLPQDWIDALEAAFEAFGDSDEWLALLETLKTLAELAKHKDKLASAFSDGEHLAEVILGLENNAAFDTLEAWATKSTPEVETKGRGPGDARLKGIVAIAVKVGHLVRGIRKVLAPVFATRAKLKNLEEGLLELVGELSVVEDLIDAGGNLGGVNPAKVKELITTASSELAGKIDQRIAGIFTALQLKIDAFGEANFVTYEELAQAVTTAALKFIPPPYKLGVKAAQALGVDTAVANNLVTAIIPKAALDGLNSTLRDLTKTITPSTKGAVDTLAKAVGGLTSDLSRELPGFFQSGFAQLSARAGATGPEGAGLGRAERLVRSSGGEPLADPVREDIEQRLGLALDDVTIHRDSAAAAASDEVGANAFTLGSHVFFGAGKFSPESGEGRRLLAHELTHVAQQRDLVNPSIVQGDWKALRARLIRKLGDKLVKHLSGIRKGSKEDLAKASAARDWIADNIDQPLRESDLRDPRIKGVFSVVRGKGGKISLRRRIRFMGKVPGVTVERTKAKGGLGILRVSLLAKAFDPKAPARAALRRSLGNCKPNEQAHHMIPLELEGDDMTKLAIKNGWQMNNGKDNGACLEQHRGSHGEETEFVRQELAAFFRESRGDWARAERPFRTFISKRRAALKARKKRIR
jgi:hypothetical protein